MGLIFDLDQTILHTDIADKERRAGRWSTVYSQIPEFKLYNGIIEAMQFANNKKLEICIVTSSPSTYCNKVLSHWNIPHHFTVCYHDTRNKKPHPEPILKAVAMLKTPVGKILSFGDKATDIEASRNAGVTSVGCLWGSLEWPILKASKPDYLLSHPSELIPLIENFFWPNS